MIVSGWQRRTVQARLWANVGRVAMQRYRDPVRATAAVRALARVRDIAREGKPTPRLVHVEGRYFTHLYTPGFPSLAFDRFLENEFARLDDAAEGSAPPRLQAVIVAVTRRCPLRCEHCCEWDVLNEPDVLSVDDLAQIVARFQSLGVTQLQFSGGEPLSRADEIAQVVSRAQPGTDFWVLSSGVGLSQARARDLKHAGVTGVCVSLDHWDGAEHNRFRGFARASEWAGRAAESAHEAGLVLALTLCPTRGFVSHENLLRYAREASRLGAGFIQILEPRAIGHYDGQDVELRAEEHFALERFFTEINFGRAHRRMPIVVYQDMARRRQGCVGAGARYVYVDTAGEIHPCPFCRRASGRVLDDDLDRRLVKMRDEGCSACGTADAGHCNLVEPEATANAHV